MKKKVAFMMAVLFWMMERSSKNKKEENKITKKAKGVGI